MTRDELIEYFERSLAGYFTHNKMPDMSGDLRKRLHTHQLRDLQDCVRDIFTAIEAAGLAIVPVEATGAMQEAVWLASHLQNANSQYRAMIEAGRI